MTEPRAHVAELPALTGLRGFAALWVVAYHLWVDATPRLLVLGPLDLTPLLSCGWAGVDLFFTLSAFLLTLPFASWQLGAAPRPALATFWGRRVLRVVPAYYAQLGVLIALAWLAGFGARPGVTQIVANLVLWTNAGPYGAAPINPVTYTLPIEFAFYLVLPLLALLLRPRAWPWLALLAIIVTQAWRHAMFAQVATADVPLRVVALEQLPGRLDQFVAGMLAAYAYTAAAVNRRLPGRATCDALFVAGALAFLALLWIIHYAVGTYWEGSALLFAWHGLAGAASAAMLYAAAAGSGLARRLLDNAPLRYLGLVSFGLYLWHFPLIHALDAAGAFAWVEGYRLPWTLPIVLAGACVLADLSYRLVERPAMRLGRRGRRPGLATELVRAP